MTVDLSTLFQNSKGQPVDFNGRPMQPIFVVKVSKGDHNFSINRIKAKSSPISGIRIKSNGGEIHLNGAAYSDIILWSDTSPPLAFFTLHSPTGGELKIWNVWKAGDIVQAWIGNAGIWVSQENEKLRLSCSDGVGAIDVTDLIVDITHTTADRSAFGS